eukprot:GEZU01017663.1.p1 GENE.GEZU01017663.1~~GEZU01017663.1.p1  ORF type:complete len:245 (+),score=30.09 GEZU01017663.1:35-769(+)
MYSPHPRVTISLALISLLLAVLVVASFSSGRPAARAQKLKPPIVPLARDDADKDLYEKRYNATVIPLFNCKKEFNKRNCLFKSHPIEMSKYDHKDWAFFKVDLNQDAPYEKLKIKKKYSIYVDVQSEINEDSKIYMHVNKFPTEKDYIAKGKSRGPENSWRRGPGACIKDKHGTYYIGLKGGHLHKNFITVTIYNDFTCSKWRYFLLTLAVVIIMSFVVFVVTAFTLVIIYLWLCGVCVFVPSG